MLEIVLSRVREQGLLCLEPTFPLTSTLNAASVTCYCFAGILLLAVSAYGFAGAARVQVLLLTGMRGRWRVPGHQLHDFFSSGLVFEPAIQEGGDLCLHGLVLDQKVPLVGKNVD